MKAVVIATDYYPQSARLNERMPLCLLPLVDRPFIQHIVEMLVDQGISEFDFVLNHLPEKIEHLLGDGKRGGSVFHYPLARDPRRPYRVLRTVMSEDGGEPLLLVHADRLPDVQIELLTKQQRLPALIASQIDG